MASSLPWKSVLCLTVAASALFFALVGDYGPGYDELIGDFQYGERSFYFLVTWDRRYLELARPVPPDLYVAGHADLVPRKLEAPYVHGHGAALASAATCWVLFRTIGVLPAVDAHHAVNLIFGLSLLIALFVFVRRLFGEPAAWLAVACWLGQPRLVAHAFFNIKDFPEACLYGLAVLAFWHGWTGRHCADQPPVAVRNRNWLIGSGVLWGLALSVKVNAVFVPVVLLGWLACVWFIRPTCLAPADWKWAVLIPVAAAGAFFLSWPYLWLYPGEFIEHVKFVLSRGYEGDFSTFLMPLWEWISATPEVVLAGAAVGLVLLFRERDRVRREFLLLNVFWFSVPLLRANLPGMRHYDGIRHFIEVTVPVATLASYGWTRIAQAVGAYLSGHARKCHRAGQGGARSLVAVRGAIIATVLVALAWPLVTTHPFELAYFNRISGGLSGAVARGHPDAGDYWAASYRKGVAWLNQRAPRGAVVAVPFAEHLVRLTRGSRYGLRPDIELLHLTGPFEREAGVVYEQLYERALARVPVYVMFVHRRSWENSVIRHARRYGAAVYAGGTLDGVPVLNIYRVPAGSEPIEGQ